MATKGPVTLSEIRAWARARGLQVAARGGISNEVIRAYNRTHRTRQYERRVAA